MPTLLLKLRNRHFFVLDLTALAIIPSLALALRLDGFEELPRYAGALLVFTLIGLAALAHLLAGRPLQPLLALRQRG